MHMLEAFMHGWDEFENRTLYRRVCLPKPQCSVSPLGCITGATMLYQVLGTAVGRSVGVAVEVSSISSGDTKQSAKASAACF
jgi:hypothetical protein